MTGQPSVDAQRTASEQAFSSEPDSRWDFNFTDDRLTRFLRDRRLGVAMHLLARRSAFTPERDSALVVCGGVGGEGAYLLRQGFKAVTVSDISPAALAVAAEREPRLTCRVLNAEDMSELADGAYDLVLVQDGLHHLPRPALGLTEMLRVARRSVVVIEPYDALIGRLIGTTWEQHDEAVNFVFRWTSASFAAVTRSYLGQAAEVADARLWDHGAAMHRAVRLLPQAAQFRAARLAYGVLKPFNRLAGNQLVGVVVKRDSV